MSFSIVVGPTDIFVGLRVFISFQHLLVPMLMLVWYEAKKVNIGSNVVEMIVVCSSRGCFGIFK